MKTDLECLPCFFRQVDRTLNYAGVHGDRARDIRHQAAKILEAADLELVPARISTLLHRLIRETTGVDPYQKIKDEYNGIARAMLPQLRAQVAGGSSPADERDALVGGVRAAIAGNIIDFGVYETIDLEQSLRESFHLPLPAQAVSDFLLAVDRAETILYLGDNAGEIAFDCVLVELLRRRGKRVIVAVKGIPVINDATRADADAVGMFDVASEIIDNGNDGIGTLLELCSERFLDVYRSADLIISKGQANFETLVSEPDDRIFFLFKVKCPVVARELGRNNGEIILKRNQGHRSGRSDAAVPCQLTSSR